MAHQFVHAYDVNGRCVSSAKLGDLGRANLEGGVPAGVPRVMTEMGLALTDWSSHENAGIARRDDAEFIIRVKPDGVQKDMRAGGAAMCFADIRRSGTRMPEGFVWANL